MDIQNVVLRFFGSFAPPPASERYSAAAHTRRTFQAFTGTTETTAGEPFGKLPNPRAPLTEIGNAEKHCEMIACVSSDPGDSARLLDYSVYFTAR